MIQTVRRSLPCPTSHRPVEVEVKLGRVLQVHVAVTVEVGEVGHTSAPMASLASVYQKQERFEDAARLYRTLVRQYRQIHGPEHRATLWSMQGVTHSLTATGRFTEVEPLARGLQMLCESNAVRIPPTMLAKSLHLLADILLHNDAPEEAEPLLRECLEIRWACEADDDRLIANTETLLGGCLTAPERYEEAESLLLESYPRIEVTGEEPDDLMRTACLPAVTLIGSPAHLMTWPGLCRSNV